MTEPNEDLRTTPAEASDDLAAMADTGIVRGVMIFTVRNDGSAYYTIGGWVTHTEVRRTIQLLETMLLNGAEAAELLGMEAQGNG